MNCVGQLIESLFDTGAVFFDLGGSRLFPDKAVYVPASENNVAGAIYRFVETWSRRSPYRKKIMANVAGTFQKLVDDHGLAAVFKLPHRIVVISRGGNPLNLSKEDADQLNNWLEIADDELVDLYDRINNGPTKKTIYAAEAIYGRELKFSAKTPSRRKQHLNKMKKYAPWGTAQDVEFFNQIKKREQSMPKFGPSGLATL